MGVTKVDADRQARHAWQAAVSNGGKSGVQADQFGAVHGGVATQAQAIHGVGGLHLEADVAAVADVGGEGQPRPQWQVALDVFPPGVEGGRAEVDAVAVEARLDPGLEDPELIAGEAPVGLGRLQIVGEDLAHQAAGVEAARPVPLGRLDVGHRVAAELVLQHDPRGEPGVDQVALEGVCVVHQWLAGGGVSGNSGPVDPRPQGEGEAGRQAVGALAEQRQFQGVVQAILYVDRPNVVPVWAGRRQDRLQVLPSERQETARKPLKWSAARRDEADLVDQQASVAVVVEGAGSGGQAGRELGKGEGGVVAGVDLVSYQGKGVLEAPERRIALERRVGLGEFVVVGLQQENGAL